MARRICVVLLALVLVMTAGLGIAGVGAASREDVSACPSFNSFLASHTGTADEPALRALAQACAAAESRVTQPADGTPCTVPSASYATIASAFADANCSEVDLVNPSYSALGIEVTHDVLLAGNGARIQRANAGTVFLVDPGVHFDVQDVQFNDAFNGSHAITNYGDLTVESSRFIGGNVPNPSAPTPDGGAIMDLGTSATITTSLFANNIGSLAGAVSHLSAGTLTITSSAFIANGGGISFAGAVYTSGGAVDIESSLFAFNTSIFGDGPIETNRSDYTHQGNIFLFNK
jgi:hypothetical protein